MIRLRGERLSPTGGFFLKNKNDLGVLAGKSDINGANYSTGLKVCGEGEWKMQTHGKGKHDMWRGLHQTPISKNLDYHAVTGYIFLVFIWPLILTRLLLENLVEEA